MLLARLMRTGTILHRNFPQTGGMYFLSNKGFSHFEKEGKEPSKPPSAAESKLPKSSGPDVGKPSDKKLDKGTDAKDDDFWSGFGFKFPDNESMNKSGGLGAGGPASGGGNKGSNGNNSGNNSNNGNNGNKGKSSVPPWITPALIIGGFGLTAYYASSSLNFSVASESSGSGITKITAEKFFDELLPSGAVQSVILVNKHYVNVRLTGRRIAYFQVSSFDYFEKRLSEEIAKINKDRDHGKIQVDLEFQSHDPGSFFANLLTVGVSCLFAFVLYSQLKGMPGGAGGMGGGIFGVGKSKAKLATPEAIGKTTFKDVAGLDEAKAEIMEFVHFLKNPQRFQKLGGKIPKGALLVGPPGTGKTLMARATAGEAGVPFFSVSGSDFIEMFVGVGPSRVRDLFADARAKAPCIIFIDEIDAVGRERKSGKFAGGNDERENTLNQLLVEMDGFTPTTNIVVLAGTNRADVLDQALLRPGRFDRQVMIDKPDLKGRKEIFEVHLKSILTNESKEAVAKKLAMLTPGMAGADIANVCNEAALLAAREEKEMVVLSHFERAIERVIGGLEKKNKIMTPQEKQIIAVHEAGHAVCGWFLEFANPLLKVSIVPRGSAALGYAQYLPTERYIHTQQQILDTMCMTLGGRVAEMLFFQHLSTGASDDLDKVTKMAYAQVTQFGMSPRLGHVSFGRGDSESFMGKPYADDTGKMIDEEVKTIIDKAYARCTELLTAKKDQVKLISEVLLKEEVIDRDRVASLLGPRPFDQVVSYDEVVSRSWKREEEEKLGKINESDNAKPEEKKTTEAAI